MKKYIKLNGALPQTDFKYGDIVVLEKRCGIKDIIVLDAVEYRRQGDIWYDVMLCIPGGGAPFLVHVANGSGIMWHNGDVLREATTDECKMLIRYLLRALNYATIDEKDDTEEER